MWRSAGLTYIRYSQIAAEVTRKAMKQQRVVYASETKLKVTRWQNGKPIKPDGA